MENEDSDPVGRDPIARFTAAAVDVGLIEPGQALDPKVAALCNLVVDMAASIGDLYPVPDQPDDTVGDVIRAELYD